MLYIRISTAALLLWSITGCATGLNSRTLGAAIPSQFQATLPDNGATGHWWNQFNDPLVTELINEAQKSSPSLDQALARIGAARAALGVAASATLPSLNVGGVASRVDLGGIANVHSTSLNALWDIDLFGAKRELNRASAARLAASHLDWQGARITLSADVASTLVHFRACRAIADVLSQDLVSREQTGLLTALKIKSGFAAPADGDLISASSADARQRLNAQGADCEAYIKALVALTGIAEPALRLRLAANGGVPHPQTMQIDHVPARVLSQRPDIGAAEFNLRAAAAEIDAAQAARFPTLSFTGNIGRSGNSAPTWSFGPLTLSLPILDGGRRRADIDAATARYDEASATYRQLARTAVREIEEALVRLDSTAQRETEAGIAARHYERYFYASNNKFKAGNGNLFELEDARRTYLSAQQALITIQREHVAAWISLYKAIGGGWNEDPLRPVPVVPGLTLTQNISHENT